LNVSPRHADSWGMTAPKRRRDETAVLAVLAHDDFPPYHARERINIVASP